MKAKWSQYAVMFLALTLIAGSATLLRGQSDSEKAPAVDSPPPFDALLATPEQRRDHIAGLPAVEKERLRRQWERFRELDDAEREQLVKLKQDLATAPDREELEAVMLGYHHWLAELSTADRAEFLELTPEKRVARIQKQRYDEQRRANDREAIATWIEQRLIEQLPEDIQRRLEKLDPQQRRVRLAIELARLRKQNRRPPWSRISEADFKELEAQLSDEAQLRLKDLSLPQKRFQLAQWIGEFAAEYAGRVNPEKMRRFFRTLSKEEREVFERDFNQLSREEMQERIEALYLERNPYNERDFMDNRRYNMPRPPGDRASGRGKPRPPRERPEEN